MDRLADIDELGRHKDGAEGAAHHALPTVDAPVEVNHTVPIGIFADRIHRTRILARDRLIMDCVIRTHSRTSSTTNTSGLIDTRFTVDPTDALLRAVEHAGPSDASFTTICYNILPAIAFVANLLANSNKRYIFFIRSRKSTLSE